MDRTGDLYRFIEEVAHGKIIPTAGYRVDGKSDGWRSAFDKSDKRGSGKTQNSAFRAAGAEQGMAGRSYSNTRPRAETATALFCIISGSPIRSNVRGSRRLPAGPLFRFVPTSISYRSGDF